MNIENLTEGLVVKNYGELCKLLGVKTKGGEGKKYQMIDFERYFRYEKDGYKFIITEIYENELEKAKRGGNNVLPFIDEMELLLINMLINLNQGDTVISTSKLMLELCMINPNYHKYFADREKLSNILDMDVGYIIDFYDTTNSTFKSALNTVTKRLESKKLLIHEKVMMVEAYEVDIGTTKDGKVKAKDVLEYDNVAKKFVTRDIKPKKINRPASAEEREFILHVERQVMVNEFGVNSIQELFKSGQINNYYKKVSDILFDKMNIRKAYKANRYTYDVNNLIKQKDMLLDEYQLEECQLALNLKVMVRIDESSNKRYEKAMSKLLEFDEYHHSKPFRANDDYVDNLNTISTSLIDITNVDSLKSNTKDDDYNHLLHY